MTSIPSSLTPELSPHSPRVLPGIDAGGRTLSNLKREPASGGRLFRAPTSYSYRKGVAPVADVSGMPFEEWRPIEGHTLRIVYARHHSARRYRLTLLRDGSARCTIPPRGSLTGGQRFVASCERWLLKRYLEAHSESRIQKAWVPGAPVWWGGKKVLLLEERRTGQLRLGTEIFPLPNVRHVDPRPACYRPYLEPLMWDRATPTLMERTLELAARHGIRVRKVTVRNQKSRWGSCSRNGSVSLNWRLVQLPPFVKDYIILHELAHRIHLNHSASFWNQVDRICPGYEHAEEWLKRFGREIL